jgi:exosome complex RNA-binding protein Rrp42 (RNase PH superfamily)
MAPKADDFRRNIDPLQLSHLQLSSRLSQSECEYVRQGCIDNCRLDGRRRDQFRHYSIVSGPSVKSSCSCSSSVIHGLQPSIQKSLFVASLSSCYGSSRLYDTITNGSNIDILCSIKAELVQPSYTVNDDIEIKLIADHSSNQTSVLLHEYEVALQQYYVPCILNSIRNAHLSDGSHENLDYSPGDILTVIPGLAAWKLYIDIYIISLLSNNDRSNSSVYYLDAVTHCINAALYETILPSISVDTTGSRECTVVVDSKTSSILDRMVLDSDIGNSKPLLRRKFVPELPIIVTTHIICCVGKNDTSLIVDATSEEEIVSAAAVHIIFIPSSHSTDDLSCNVGAVWKTRCGSISMSLLPKCIETAISAAPMAYQHFHV